MKDKDVLGVVLLVIGLLLLLDFLRIPFLVTILGIVLVVVGLLMLTHRLRGATWLAVVCVVLGILVLVPDVPGVRQIVGAIADLFVTIVAILLIVLGILKLAGKA